MLKARLKMLTELETAAGDTDCLGNGARCRRSPHRPRQNRGSRRVPETTFIVCLVPISTSVCPWRPIDHPYGPVILKISRFGIGWPESTSDHSALWSLWNPNIPAMPRDVRDHPGMTGAMMNAKRSPVAVFIWHANRTSVTAS